VDENRCTPDGNSLIAGWPFFMAEIGASGCSADTLARIVEDL
jgi:hypothetical protein